jgi:hypothetical protein
MSKSKATAALPRSLTGGYSDRYEERHAERGAQNRYGPEWTVAAASRLHVALKADAQKQGLGLYLNTLLILLSEARQRALITAWARNRGLSKPDAQLVGLQLAHYGQRAQQACTGMDPDAIHVDAAAKKVLHSLFKVLRERSKHGRAHRLVRAA